MNRISKTFALLKTKNKKALIPFITAGDPNPSMTVPIMHQLVQAGADILELGVPFSDPMADGPTIQRSSERALKHHVKLSDVLMMVGEFRKTNIETPVVLMGYANPIEAMGYANFGNQAQQCGVDGVLTVDYPPEECEEWVKCLANHAIDAIFLLSPTTTPERVKKVAELAQGYIYYVSLKGVTGAAHLDLDNVREMLTQLRLSISIPIGVGFGIRDGATAKAISELADAIVVGSRIIEEIECSSNEVLLENVGRISTLLRSAMDENTGITKLS